MRGSREELAPLLVRLVWVAGVHAALETAATYSKHKKAHTARKSPPLDTRGFLAHLASHLKQPGCSRWIASIFSMIAGGNHIFRFAAASGFCLSACSTSYQPSSRIGHTGLMGKP